MYTCVLRQRSADAHSIISDNFAPQHRGSKHAIIHYLLPSDRRHSSSPPRAPPSALVGRYLRYAVPNGSRATGERRTAVRIRRACRKLRNFLPSTLYGTVAAAGGSARHLPLLRFLTFILIIRYNVFILLVSGYWDRRLLPGARTLRRSCALAPLRRERIRDRRYTANSAPRDSVARPRLVPSPLVTSS